MRRPWTAGCRHPLKSTVASGSTKCRRCSSVTDSPGRRLSARPMVVRRTSRRSRCSSLAPKPRDRNTCAGVLSGELVGAYALSEPGSGIGRVGCKDARGTTGRRQLRVERREDVDHQPGGFARPVHRLCQGRRRAFPHRSLSERCIWRSHERQGRAQDGPPRIVETTAIVFFKTSGIPADSDSSARSVGPPGLPSTFLNFSSRFKLGAACGGGRRARSARRSGTQPHAVNSVSRLPTSERSDTRSAK